jgi:hemoglobin/transferrin/lactoferrin receptor protein
MKNYIYVLMLISVFIITNISLAQIGGVVIDAESKEPLSNATVILKGDASKEAAQTNIKGEFYFSSVSKGTYLLTVSYIGYEKSELTIDTKTDRNLTKLNIALKSSPVNTGEIRVTSTRQEKLIKDVPLPIEIVSEETIARIPSNTVPDVLDKKPGLSLVRDGIWATDINIRGLSRYNVVTMIDGNRIETSVDIAARLSMIDVNNIDRIEVIKGGASAIYGTGATGGVLNVITKGGHFNNINFISGNFGGTYNSVNNSPEGNLNLNLGGKFWYLNFSGMARNAENTKTPQGDIPNSQFTDNNISLQAGISPVKNHELKLTFDNYFAKDVGIPGGNPLFPTAAVVRYPSQRMQTYSAEYKINDLIKPLKTISVKYYYEYILRDVENIPNQVTIKPKTATTPKQRISVLSITPNARHYTNGAELQTEWKIADNNSLIAGIDAWRRSIDSKREKNQKIEVYDTAGVNIVNTIYKTIGEKPIPDADFLSIGGYAQDEMKFFEDKLKITISGRADNSKTTNSAAMNPVYEIVNGGARNYNPAGQVLLWNDNNVNEWSYSGNVGMLYNLVKDFDITFSFARSYRVPTPEERYQFIDLGSVVRVGNPNLTAEKGLFFDLGTRLWKDKCNLIADIFLNTFTDQVVEMPGTFEGRNALVKMNVGKSRLYGFDMSFMYNFYKTFVGYMDLSYVRGEDTENDVNLPQIPPLNGTIGIRTGILKYINLDLSATLFAEQNKIATGEISTPGYAIFNFYVSSMPINISNLTHITINAGIENILDKQYRNHLSTNRGMITSEPGRNFFVKANIAF